MTQLPTQARIVIIGGGAIGTSVAYQLAKAGARDVLLVEKAQLTHGCTWHAAGLVGQLRTKANLTRLMQNSVAVFDRLEAETGQAIDWKRVGSLRLAGSEARWAEIRRTMTIARSFSLLAVRARRSPNSPLARSGRPSTSMTRRRYSRSLAQAI